MRAHEPTATSRADAISRARMLMKSHLWWLEGFPHAGAWVALPLDGNRAVETVALDRSHLRRALRAVGVLEGEYPRALASIVGDAKRWADAARRVVAVIAPWVHRGAPPPGSLFDTDLHPRAARDQARALAGQGEAIAIAVGALSWQLATRADRASRYLRWLAAHLGAVSAAVEKHDQPAGVVLAVRLAHLGASLGDRLVSPLAALLADPHAHDAPLRDRDQLLARAVELCRAATMQVDRLPAERSPSRLPVELAEWTAWLCSVDSPVQRRFLRLLAACDLPALLAAWSGWWPDFLATIDGARALRRIRDPDAAFRAEQRVRLAFERLRARVPPAIDIRTLGRALRELGAESAEACFQPAAAALARVPARLGLRAAFVVHWGVRARSERGTRARGLSRWLGYLRDYLRAAGHLEDALQLFAADAMETAARGHGHSLEHALAGVTDAQVKRFFAALAALSATRPGAINRAVAHGLVELAALAEPPALIAELTARLFETGQRAAPGEKEMMEVALTLCGGELDPFAPLVRALREMAEGEAAMNAERLARAVIPAFADDPALLRGLILGPDRAHIVACGEKLAALAAMGETVVLQPPSPGEAKWIAELPARLHPALALLARSSRDAQAIARRMIAAVWRSGGALERERDAIARQLALATGERRRRLELRLAGLTRGHGSARPPSERTLRRLEEKLRRRAALERLRALESAAGDRLGPAAARYLGVASPPDWVLEPRALRLLPHFAALKPRARALARELLRARAGPPPWDLRDHPANRGFLDRLGAAGIDTRAWIDGIGTIERETAVGRIRLALADDPLDVFHMGRHFGTCLSPGAFNFFAVVANAADINKRVLYARAEAGAVIGRQLLCLTDAGSLLAFHPYTHDERTGFADLASELVRELARRMGTSLASQGQVSPLVAADWYDDGPVDLTGQLGFLVDGTTFRDALASVAVADLPALIASELKSGVLDPQVAPMILDLPELLARPELVHAVLPMIRDPAELSHLARLRAASLLEAAGAAGEAADRFGDAIERSVEEQFRAHGSAAIEPIDILCRIAPARGLRALRNTRPSGVRSWSDESLASRLLAGATALEALHRPAQARELLRRAARARGPRHAVVLARERLGEVG